MVDSKSSHSSQLTAQALRQAGSQRPGRVGRPRLDHYMRLLHRFYEPLILLGVLGVTRGAHSTTTDRAIGPDGMARRRLLQNLSYMCDFDKGGPTTTSIGLEERQDCYNFWVSSNKACFSKIATFLRSTLEYVSELAKNKTETTEDMIQTLAIKCIQFARKRVSKESKLFFQAVNRCAKYLDPETLSTDTQLGDWLKTFDQVDYVKLCNQAYAERQSKEASLLDRDGAGLLRGSGQSDAAKAFGDTKHYLGRLAHHIRAARQVIDDAHEAGCLLETYSIRQVPTSPGVLRPNADDQTHLKGILKRMLSETDKDRFSELSTALEEMDAKLELTEKIKEEYAKEDFQPIVHCEIQVLEYFHKNKLAYADDDRYIGCSKPACFCCHLYIQNHPARCEVPDSHQKIYLNWSPPNLDLEVRNSNSPEFKAQRGLLSKMLTTIRTEALDQIAKKAGPKTWHPDSLTGITSIEKVLSQLDISEQSDPISLTLALNLQNTGSSILRASAFQSNVKGLQTSSPPVLKVDVSSPEIGHYCKQDTDAYDESDHSDGGANVSA